MSRREFETFWLPGLKLRPFPLFVPRTNGTVFANANKHLYQLQNDRNRGPRSLCHSRSKAAALPSENLRPPTHPWCAKLLITRIPSSSRGSVIFRGSQRAESFGSSTRSFSAAIERSSNIWHSRVPVTRWNADNGRKREVPCTTLAGETLRRRHTGIRKFSGDQKELATRYER